MSSVCWLETRLTMESELLPELIHPMEVCIFSIFAYMCAIFYVVDI